MSFREKATFDMRAAESARVRAKFPDRYPIIVEKAGNTDVPDIDKHKFLVPGNMTMGQFMYVIRQRLRLLPEKALFIFVNDTFVQSSMLIKEIYARYVDYDGFVYMIYMGETTFGCV